MSEKKPPSAPPAPRVMSGSAKNNIWRCRVVDGAGNPVQPAPGQTHLAFRGPASVGEAKEGIRILLDSKRADALRAGEDDPGYRMAEDSLEPMGHSDSEIGQFFVPGAAPLDFPTDAAVKAQHDQVIRERLGEAKS